MQPSAPADLIELAEEPSLSMPDEPDRHLLWRDGYLVVVRPRWATVERVRLGDVERAVEDVAAIGTAHGLDHANWWVGARSTPADLGERLLAAGLEPDPEMPLSKTLTLTRPPAGETTVEVRAVTTFEDYLHTREIAGAVWSEDRADRDLRAVWDALEADGRSRYYLASIEGEPVGFGYSVFTPRATLMLGGAVLPEARGRGAYLAIVHARWRDSVARGVPRLLTGAGPMSAPILERLGFEQIGETRPFRQLFVGSGS
ncbi:MAG: GNAT family N-acetyltransferase [Actinobacteria bacterium]|nr:GNAT family N-acetyltransferase [Actinomycetota bacterium]